MEDKLLIILESLENKGDINSEIDLSETGYTPKVIKEVLQSLGYKMVSGSWDCYDFSEEYGKEGHQMWCYLLMQKLLNSQ